MDNFMNYKIVPDIKYLISNEKKNNKNKQIRIIEKRDIQDLIKNTQKTELVKKNKIIILYNRKFRKQ